MSARKITKSITLPDGDVLTIRKLSAKKLRRAAEAQMFHAAEVMERVSGLQARVKAVMGITEAPKAETPAPTAEPAAETPEATPDPMAHYEAHTLVREGVVAVEGEDVGDPAALEAFVDDLSEDDLAYAAEQVLRLSAPKLFLTKAEQAVAQKND